VKTQIVRREGGHALRVVPLTSNWTRDALSLAEVRELRAMRHAQWCGDCRRVHDARDRESVLRRLLPMRKRDLVDHLQEHRACLYGDLGFASAGMRALQRDLARIAVHDDYATDPMWSLRP
jgi:hypothetical protein